MGDKIFLQEMAASIGFFDMRGFSTIVAQLGPVDLGVTLRRYYEHIEQSVLGHDGRIIKFMSDGVLALFPSISAKDHAGNGLAAVKELRDGNEAWLADNEKFGLPVMEFSSGLASGSVLFGELGTARQRSHDVLGQPVILAIRLARLATERGTPHLISASTIQIARQAQPAIEVESAELAGQKLRIYRLLSDQEIDAAEKSGEA